MMTRVAIWISLALFPLLAQEKTILTAPEAVIIPVKTLSGDAFNRLAKMLEVFGVPFKADEKLRTIVAYGPKEVTAQIRAVVEQLDRPGSEAAIGRNIDMTLSYLLCSTKEPPSARAIPADLEPVVRQLRAATPCKDVAVLDTVPLRLQEGMNSEQSAVMPGLAGSVPGQAISAFTNIRTEAIIRKESERYIRFRQVKIVLRVPYATGGANNTQFQNRELLIDTAGDFKEGQKTVLGKISGIDGDSALFIVIALKILD